jgi:hypothetical protein
MERLPAEEIERASATPAGPRHYEEFTTGPARRWKLVPYDAVGGFEDWFSLEELFTTYYQGVNPNRGLEGSIVEIDRNTLAARMREYYSDVIYEDFCERHPVLCESRAGYNAATVRQQLQESSSFSEAAIVPYLVFPFDIRFLYYETAGRLLNRRRPELWENLPSNEFLLAVPEPRQISESRPLFARCLFDLHLHDRGSVGFPAQVMSQPSAQQDLFDQPATTGPIPLANLSEQFWQAIRDRWGFEGGIDGDDARRFVRSLFRVCLAVCLAPDYQEEHKESLAQDWAHVPIPRQCGAIRRAGDCRRFGGDAPRPHSKRKGHHSASATRTWQSCRTLPNGWKSRPAA